MKKLFYKYCLDVNGNKYKDYILGDSKLDSFYDADLADYKDILKEIEDIIKECETYLADKHNKDNEDIVNGLDEFYDIRDYLIANILGLEKNEIELEM